MTYRMLRGNARTVVLSLIGKLPSFVSFSLQVSFIDYFVIDLYTAWDSKYCTENTVSLQNITHNAP